MAKIKQIGGNSKEVSYDAKDILIWINCSENKNHPSYLITPYDFTHNKLRYPLCEDREVIIPYQIRRGVNLFEENKSGVFGKPEYFTTIAEAKEDVLETYNSTVKKMFPDAERGELVIVSDLKCDCGSNIEFAKYEDGTQLIGRMDGGFDGGEFYIEIVKS